MAWIPGNPTQKELVMHPVALVADVTPFAIAGLILMAIALVLVVSAARRWER
jgi:hypothetical protein